MPIDPLGKAGASHNALPFSPPKTGFASQPSEHQELELNIHDLVVKHPHGVFYFRAAGPPFAAIQIYDGDIVIVDRVEAAADGKLVVAVDQQEYIVRWVEHRDGKWFLVTDTEDDAPIPLLDPNDIVGVVTHVIHEVRRRARKGGAG